MENAVESKDRALRAGAAPRPTPRPDRSFYASNRAFGRFGIRSFPPQIMAQPHRHGHIEINWLTAGTMDYDFDGKPTVVSANRLVAFWAGLPHQTVALDGEAMSRGRQINIYLPVDAFLLMPQLGRLPETMMGGGVVCLAPDAVSIDMLDRWHQDYRSGNSLRTDIAKTEIGAMFRRASLTGWETLLPAWIETEGKRHPTSSPVRYVVAMVRHIVENLAEPLTAKGIADVVGLHPNYALTLFTKVMQISVQKFVVRMRLIRDFNCSVLIIERGPATTARLMAMPAGYMKYLGRDDFLEMHHTVPQAQLGGRGPIVPVAKALGGGSAVNAMVYMRGQREDYDGWAAHLGNGAEWSYADMLPHFTGIEANTKFNDEFHGISGNLRVSEPGYISGTTEDFILAAQGLGHKFNPDFNGARQNGVGIMQHTYGQWGRYKERSDAKKAFLDPLDGDDRLGIITEARVDRIVIENGRAIGVAYTRNGESHTVHAGREVLVASGTYNSAKLLMLSGIGPADHLRKHGIAITADVPGVGANLQDHHEVPVIATTKAKSGYFGQDKGWPMVRNGLQYLLFNSGPVTTTGIESCLFYDPDGGDRPTIQLYCAPIVYLDRDVSSAKPTYGVTFTSCLLRPKARGSVKLRSANPADQPLVDCNFFGDPDDLRLTLASLKVARQLLDTAPFKDKIADELLPGRAVQDEAALSKFAGQTVKTNYHPSGSLRMGPDNDPMSVVDGDLKVRGIQGLRVIDCSIIPFIPSGNTNAPAMAIGSKAASLIGA